MLALLISGAAAAQVQQWVIYEPPGGGFRVDLPAPPTVTSEEVKRSEFGPGHAINAHAQSSGIECTARSTNYQPGAITRDPLAALERWPPGLAAKGLELRAVERFAIGSNPAIRFAFDMPDDRSGRYAVVMVGDRAVVLTCIVAGKGQENSTAVARVFKSFVVTAPR